MHICLVFARENDVEIVERSENSNWYLRCSPERGGERETNNMICNSESLLRHYQVWYLLIFSLVANLTDYLILLLILILKFYTYLYIILMHMWLFSYVGIFLFVNCCIFNSLCILNHMSPHIWIIIIIPVLLFYLLFILKV